MAEKEFKTISCPYCHCEDSLVRKIDRIEKYYCCNCYHKFSKTEYKKLKNEAENKMAEKEEMMRLKEVDK